MKFLVEYAGETEQRLLTYDVEECSFDIDPVVNEVCFTAVVNKLNLTVLDENKVVEIWGFCGYRAWIRSDYTVPKYKKGNLKVIDDLEGGFSYGVNDIDNEFPMYINLRSGWVCIGNPEGSGDAVEFINNCVAVIDKNNEFVSLWLKPQIIGELEF